MNIFRRIIGRGTEFALLLAATIIITVVMLNLYTAQGIKLNSDIGWVIGGFIGVFTIAHLTLCFLAPQADQFMLPVGALGHGVGGGVGRRECGLLGWGSDTFMFANAITASKLRESLSPRRMENPHGF